MRSFVQTANDRRQRSAENRRSRHFLPGGGMKCTSGKPCRLRSRWRRRRDHDQHRGNVTPLAIAPLTDAPALQMQLMSIGCGGGEHPAKEAVRVRPSIGTMGGQHRMQGMPVQGGRAGDCSTAMVNWSASASPLTRKATVACMPGRNLFMAC